jgi:hypothetical protein
MASTRLSARRMMARNSSNAVKTHVLVAPANVQTSANVALKVANVSKAKVADSEASVKKAAVMESDSKERSSKENVSTRSLSKESAKNAVSRARRISRVLVSLKKETTNKNNV